MNQELLISDVTSFHGLLIVLRVHINYECKVCFKIGDFEMVNLEAFKEFLLTHRVL
jgi:hypothetical protein